MDHSYERPNRVAQQGFTLIDLMITISIVGILASIALPNYQNFVARSRQTEAKLALSALYLAETSYYGEKNTYTTCASEGGYTRPAQNNFYSVGFGNASFTCGDTGANDCHIIDYSLGTFCPAGAYPAGGYFPADRSANGVPVTRAVFNASTPTVISTQAFTAAAVGKISPRTGAVPDVWVIDQNKQLANSVVGF